MKISQANQKKRLFCRKSAESDLDLVPKSRKNLIGPLSCMHKGPKCIQTLCNFFSLCNCPKMQRLKKFLLLKTTKTARYVRSLGKKPILEHSQRLKKVLHVLRCAKNTPHRSKKNANTTGFSDKNVYLLESLRFCR